MNPAVFVGTFRLYYNRAGAAPLVWCVAGDGFEIAVPRITLDTRARTVFQPKPIPDDEDGKPSAWLEATGTLIITPDGARIEGLR